MDINAITQAANASYENNKVEKDNNKKNQTEASALYGKDAAAEYTKSESVETVVKRDTATIERLKAEAELRTSQLRSLVEKMLLKQGITFTSLKDAFEMIEEDSALVDEETALEATKEIADDGYWGVEQTSERLFSFAKALCGNDTAYADTMLEALQKGFDDATKSWGRELPELCQKTLEATKKKLNDWKEGKTSETPNESAEASPDLTIESNQ